MNVEGIQSLKMIASKPGAQAGDEFPGLADLLAKGWRQIEEVTPADGRRYVVLGLPAETAEAKIARLEAELAAYRLG
jgi:hypothetical protein